MKTLNQFLFTEEVKWTKSLFDHLFTLKLNDIKNDPSFVKRVEKSGKDVYQHSYLIPEKDSRYQLPLVPAMIERIVGSVMTYGIHASNAENLEKLIDIQGKKSKQISVYTTDEEGRLSSGVWGGGGVFSILHGNVYAGATVDIMSIVDKQGRRLVDLGPNNELAYAYDYENLVAGSAYKSMWNDLKAFRNSLVNKLYHAGVKSISPEEYFDRAIDTSKINSSIKRDYIKKYIDGTEKILKKHKKVFVDMYIGWARKQSKKWNFVADSYDEMVMGNFEIVKVYVDEEYKEEFIIHFAKIPDDAWFKDGFVEPSWDSIKSKVGFNFPVEFISGSDVQRLLPRFLKGLKK